MTLALAPVSLLYGAAVRARTALYRSGALKAHRVGAPVISVGNITTGGTGKTPLVEWLARAAAREGLRVCVLTRGYGRADEGRRVVVSDGERLLADVKESGDEPRVLAESLLGAAAVVCDADRVAAARWALENLGAEVFILDDGFQHLRIARDLDVVTVDATSPWGGGHLLPRGRLREPPGALGRADCVVITRADLARDLGELRAKVRRLSGGRAEVLTSRVRTLGLCPLGQPAGDNEHESGAVPQPVAAFCAVGNPRAFFEHLKKDGHELCFMRAFPDHHPYSQADLNSVTGRAARHGARTILTTAKDAVKLSGYEFPLPCFVVEIKMEFDDEGRLLRLAREALAHRTKDQGAF